MDTDQELIAVLLVFVHFYGLADYPDDVVKLMMLCLIPLTLAATRTDLPEPRLAA